MDHSIIIFPYFGELQDGIEKLRKELAMMVLELDQLRLVECKNIEMAYWFVLGGLEYNAYKAQCRFLRLRRKIDLIQMKKNRQEAVILSKIEKILDKEFTDYQKELDERMNRVNAALEHSRKPFLSEENMKELKHLYRVIVKALHPDLHPDFGEVQLQLFQNAKAAYENGDLTSMRVIAEIIDTSEPPKPHENVIQWMCEERERLKQSIYKIQEEIKQVKSSYPYTLKEFVDDKTKREARKAEIKTIIQQYEEASALLQKRIEKMLEE